MNITEVRRRVERLCAERELTLRQVDEAKTRLAQARVDREAALQAQAVVQGVAEELQTSANRRIAAIVTRCLSAVFGSRAAEFRILFPKKRGRTEAQLEFAFGDNSLSEPLEESDGGSVDVAAMGLRLACLTLATPKRRRLLVLDEPLRNVHGAKNRERAAELLLALAREMDLQIIIATGLEWLKVGNVIDLEQDESCFTERETS